MSAGSVLTVGLAGPELGDDELGLLRELQPAGVILFGRNVESLPQLSALTAVLDAELDRPLLLIDQEGGRVDRLKGLVGSSPPARRLAAAGRAEVREHASLMARAVRVAGLNFNCAPVVDLDEGHEGNGIGDRALGLEPAVVAELAGSVLEAHAEAGVAACLKHFPGLGRTRSDTHELRPVVELDAEELGRRELGPYRLLAGRAPAVMVCHAAFPRVSGRAVPASLSREVVTGLLRRGLPYDGAVVTDDLEMGAVTELSPARRAVSALEAGCDLLLFCKDPEQAREAHAAVEGRAREDAGFAARVEEAGSRVERLRQDWGGRREGAGDEAECRAVSKALERLRERVDGPVA